MSTSTRDGVNLELLSQVVAQELNGSRYVKEEPVLVTPVENSLDVMTEGVELIQNPFDEEKSSLPETPKSKEFEVVDNDEGHKESVGDSLHDNTHAASSTIATTVHDDFIEIDNDPFETPKMSIQEESKSELSQREIDPEILALAIQLVKQQQATAITHETIQSSQAVTEVAATVTQDSRETTERASSKHVIPQTKLGKVICFTGMRPYGGQAGKTTFALNEAALAVERGSRVALVELDPGGVCQERLDIKPEELGVTVNRWLTSERKHEDEILAIKMSLTNTKYGISALLMDRTADDETAFGISAEETREILGKLKKAFDLVVVDLPGAITSSAVAAWEMADLVYWVGLAETAQFPSYRDHIHRWVGKDDPDKVDVSKCRFILNMAAKRRVSEEFERVVGQKLTELVFSYREVYACSEKKKIFSVDSSHRHRFTKAIGRLLDDIGIGEPYPQRWWSRRKTKK